MVINYMRPNERLEFDGYLIPLKDVIVNQTKRSRFLSSLIVTRILENTTN